MTQPAFVKLREWIQERQRGSCRILSLGAACECPLCLLDNLHDAALRGLDAGPPPPALTAEETERLAFLQQLMSRSGRFDNYEPTASEARDYDELRRKAAAVRASPSEGEP